MTLQQQGLLPGGFTSPPFRPTTQPPNHPSTLTTPSEPWIEVLIASCHFGLSSFLATIKELCLHPERNSSLILRADQLQPKGIEVDEGPRLGMDLVEEVRVRMMPKQPKRDPKMDQTCMFFRKEGTHEEKEQGLVLYIPEIKEASEAPYYYPPVRRIAFRWEGCEPVEDDEATPVKGRLSIAYLPWPETPSVGRLPVPRVKPRKRSPLAGPAIGEESTEAVPPPAVVEVGTDEHRLDKRIQRVCLALLERVFKHGYGTMVGYKKRVQHDVSESEIALKEGTRSKG